MKENLPENNQQKHQFQTYYCAGCQQVKPCQLLTGWDSEWQSYCCGCYYHSQQERAEGYNSYDEVLTSHLIEREKKLRQLQLLSRYPGCSSCRSKEVDAYSWYEKNRLVCQPCLVSKERGSSSPISFQQEKQWYKKRWGINLVEWLENFSQLPVNKNCAEQWLKDREHLNNCQCLEQAARETFELFANALTRDKARLEQECRCVKSQKTRTPYFDSAGSGWTYCGKCEKIIESAGHHGVIKNRNDPRFWGLTTKEKVLCLKCLREFQPKMSLSKKYTFNKYLRRYIFSPELGGKNGEKF